jgi:HK97 family phage prohead protease
MTLTHERRYLSKGLPALEVRKAQDGPTTIVGYAAVFDRLSEDLGGFVEKIAPGSFKRTLSRGDDCAALFNHDPNLVLGRRSAGTLTVIEDSVGLRFTISVNLEDPQARSVASMIERRDVIASSFGFDTSEATWGETPDGYPLRTIHEIAKLWDVAPVVFPAYPDTEVLARSALAGLAEKRSLPLDPLVQALRAGRLREYLADPRPEASPELILARRRMEAVLGG